MSAIATASAPSPAPPGTVSVAHRLLNPRGYMSIDSSQSMPKSEMDSEISPNTSPLSPQSRIRSAPDLDVKFVNARLDDDGSGVGGGRKRNVGQIGDDVNKGPNHTSFIENMYGVEMRGPQHHPYKRVKSAETLGLDERAKVTMKMKVPFATAGNSGLGKWMKDREYSNSPGLNVVDLTNSKEGTYLLCMCVRAKFSC